MKRPQEHEYSSFTAYARALENYCTSIEQPEPIGEIVQAFADLTAVSIPVMPPVGTKLYASPPKHEWVGLTDGEKAEIQSLKWWDWEDAFDLDGYTRAIEAKLKEKNT